MSCVNSECLAQSIRPTRISDQFGGRVVSAPDFGSQSGNQLLTVERFIAQSPSLSSFLDMASIMLKGT